MSRSIRSGWIALAVLVAGALVAPALAPAASVKPTKVKSLHGYKHRLNKRALSALPAPAAEVFDSMEGDPATLQEPLARAGLPDGAPRVFAFHGRNGSALCVVQARQHAQGACFTSLPLARGSLNAALGVMDGVTFASGLAADGVHDLTVTVSGETVDAVIANNAWLAVLPDGSKGTDAMKLRAVDVEGKVLTATVPGIPAPSAG